ncbi:hypothetical protein AH04_283 [Erwinia phage AH04]|uniref:Uncharacterized protein n=1 Tax=Erwinia phage AH04 TaxID=2869569 RepID=A0AAE8BQH3_9CAUD|nr:hypothetical protein PQC02_gp031 [Erwinia phage AH04]QZA70756.1 hypothetical protein AH04_283 [Erwinia phage AH04]
MDKNEHVKHKRKIVVPPPGLIGFISSHRLTPVKRLTGGKLVPTEKYLLDVKLCFFWPSSYVEIHNNADEDLMLSFNAYLDKIKMIRVMCEDMVEHLNTGKGPFVRREFLNDATINDGFGGTLFMTADPDHPTNYCIFEVSSCYKKYRHSGTPSVLKKYLKDLISFINDAETDLVLIKEKIDQTLLEKKKDEK